MTNLSTRQRMRGDALVTSCLRTRRLLQRFLDGEVDPALAERIARHLAACRACGLQAHVYQEIKDSVRRHAAAPSPDTLQRLTEFAETLPHRAP